MKFCGNYTSIIELVVRGHLANVSIEIVFLLCHLLRKESPTLSLVELILVLFVVRKGEFLDDDLGVNQTYKMDYQKGLPVLQIDSMN